MDRIWVLLTIMYVIQWVCFIVGFIVIQSKRPFGQKIEKYTWNARIDVMQKTPFKQFMWAYSEKKYLFTVLFVIVTNVNALIVQFITGFFLLSPILALGQGVMMGVVVAQGDRKTRLFSFVVCIFEIGAMAFAGGLGLYIGIEWIFKSSFSQAFQVIINQKYYLIPLICLILNGVIEASGVFLDIKGVPGVKAVKEKIYK